MLQIRYTSTRNENAPAEKPLRGGDAQRMNIAKRTVENYIVIAYHHVRLSQDNFNRRGG